MNHIISRATVVIVSLFVLFLTNIHDTQAVSSTDIQRTVGSEKAQVSMEAWIGFQDPFSQLWYKNTYPEIKKNYVETGKVKIIFHYAPLEQLYLDEIDRSLAAECAAQQKMFMPMIERLFTESNFREEEKDYTTEELISIGEGFGLKTKTFAKCMKDSATRKNIDKSFKNGISGGLQGTPWFRMKSDVVEGAVSYNVFSQKLDSLLSERTSGQKKSSKQSVCTSKKYEYSVKYPSGWVPRIIPVGEGVVEPQIDFCNSDVAYRMFTSKLSFKTEKEEWMSISVTDAVGLQGTMYEGVTSLTDYSRKHNIQEINKKFKVGGKDAIMFKVFGVTSVIVLYDKKFYEFRSSPNTEETVFNEFLNTFKFTSANRTAVLKTSKGIIEIELFEDQMPITTKNFVKLAEEKFYNGTKFHRVIDGFMIQGGDPNTKGKDVSKYGIGGPGYTIQDEFVAGKLLKNTRGTIAMANNGQPNSGGSQFFINTVDNTGLDFDKEPLASSHPVFGRVVKGMSVVNAIAKTKTGPTDLPVKPVVIKSIVIKVED